MGFGGASAGKQSCASRNPANPKIATASGIPIRHHRRPRYFHRPYFPSIMLAKKPDTRKNSPIRKLCSQ
jgi:hypothetical protein